MNARTHAQFLITIDGETATVGTAAELAVALDVLQGAYDRSVLSQLAPHLPAIIRSGRDLLTILRALVSDDQLYLVNTLGAGLEDIIHDSRELRDILAMVSDSIVEETLLRQIGGSKLRQLAAVPAELADLLEWIYGDSDSLLLGLLGDAHLAQLFDSGGELSLVLAMLSRPLQQNLVSLLGWDTVVELIHNYDDLAALLGALPAGTSAGLIAHIPAERLQRLVRDPATWHKLSISLEQRELDLLHLKLEAAHAQ